MRMKTSMSKILIGLFAVAFSTAGYSSVLGGIGSDTSAESEGMGSTSGVSSNYTNAALATIVGSAPSSAPAALVLK